MSVVVSDLYSVILKAGRSAAISAGTTGPVFDITGFRIGSTSAKEGAVADENDTDVDNLVYEGDSTDIYYAAIPDQDACLFRIVLDETVGDFDIGQICLMLGNIAFSKSVMFSKIPKWKSVLPGRIGNSWSFDIILSLSVAQSCVNLSLLKSLYAILPEVADETELPAANASTYNCYLVRNHTKLGVPVTALRRNGSWFFSPHRTQAGQGEGVLAVTPAMFASDVKINHAVYYDSVTSLYKKADASDAAKFPIGVRSSLYEITQVGYVTRYALDDVWPSPLIVNTHYSVQVGTPGVPGATASYHGYGRAVSADLMYIDMAGKFTANRLAAVNTIAGVMPLDKTHQHLPATFDASGFLSNDDYTRLHRPSSFILGEGGVNVAESEDQEMVTLSLSGEIGFLIYPDAYDPNLRAGAPVTMKLVNGVRTWVAADPANGLRPEGLMSDNRTRIITGGRMKIASAYSAWPTPLTVGNLYFAGTGVSAGRVLTAGDWIIGQAINTTEMIVQLEPIASSNEHTQAVETPEAATSVKNATPRGVLEMLSEGYLSKLLGVTAERGLRAVRKSDNVEMDYDISIRSTLGDGSRLVLQGTGIVNSVTNALSVAPASLASMTQYTQIAPMSFVGSGGAAPYTYACVSGSLPIGLSLTPQGALSGTPMKGGSYVFTICATDANGLKGSRTYSGVVNTSVISIGLSPSALPALKQNTAMSATQLTATGGYEPYTFAVKSGVLPVGVTLQTNGLVSGTPTKADPYSAVIKATDVYGNVGTRTYAGSVEPAGVNLALVVGQVHSNPAGLNPVSEAIDIYGYIRDDQNTAYIGNSTHFNLWKGTKATGTLTANLFHGVKVLAILDWRRSGFMENVSQNWYNYAAVDPLLNGIQIYLEGHLPQNAFTYIDVPGVGRLYSADAALRYTPTYQFFYQDLPASIYPPASFYKLFALANRPAATLWAWHTPSGAAIANGTVTLY